MSSTPVHIKSHYFWADSGNTAENDDSFIFFEISYSWFYWFFPQKTCYMLLYYFELLCCSAVSKLRQIQGRQGALRFGISFYHHHTEIHCFHFSPSSISLCDFPIIFKGWNRTFFHKRCIQLNVFLNVQCSILFFEL